MRYVCLNCGNRWDVEDGKEEKKIRCPSCLRVTGIEKIAAPQAPGKGAQSPWLVPGIVVTLLAAAAGGYAVWRSSAPAEVGDEVPLGPLDHDVLVGHLRRLRVETRGVADLLTADEGVESIADHATEGHRGSASEMGDAMQAWMRERAAQHAFTRWSLGVPRETPVADAGTVRTWIHEDGARRRLYPLEAAALMASALRTRGVNAMIAEAWEFPGDRSPPDPSGHFGYFVVAVYDGDVTEDAEPHLYDPWGGHEVPPEQGKFRVLTDVEAIGAALNLRAIHMLVRENDPQRAMELSGDAIRLDGRSPAARSVRGAILIAAGGAQDGIAEFEAAAQLRGDAPRHQLLGGVKLAQGDVEGARRELAAALEIAPDYASAHAALAAVDLQEAEPDLAREELETAQRLDPDLHTLPGLWAGYYASTGELDRAVEHANVAIERNPSDVQTHMMAAQVFRQAARYDAMRREARRVMELVPAGQRDQMSQLLRRVLGPTALEEEEEPTDEELLAEDEELDEEGEGEETGEGSEFRLGEGSRLLGGGGGGGGRPRLGEGELAPGGGSGDEPLLMLGDPSRLRLGGSGAGGDDLRLDLDE